MKKSTKILKLITSIALVAAIGVGFTLAYLSSVTDTKENKFTSSSNITGTLKEEEFWDETWDDYKPGDAQSKTPIISLDANSESAYVGMKVEFFNTTNGKVAITADEFTTKFGTLTYNNGDLNIGNEGTTWTNVAVTSNASFYMYNTILNKSESTTPLFDKVTINTGIYTFYDITGKEGTVYKTNAEGEKVEVTDNYVLVDETTKFFIKSGTIENPIYTEVTGDTKLPSFQIDVTGYATQANVNGANVTVATAKGELLKLASLSAK